MNVLVSVCREWERGAGVFGVCVCVCACVSVRVLLWPLKWPGPGYVLAGNLQCQLLLLLLLLLLLPLLSRAVKRNRAKRGKCRETEKTTKAAAMTINVKAHQAHAEGPTCCCPSKWKPVCLVSLAHTSANLPALVMQFKYFTPLTISLSLSY